MKYHSCQAIPPNGANIPVCAVDLGFAKEKLSLGIAFSDRNEPVPGKSFGAGIEEVSTWLASVKNIGNTEAVLIIEAPLSMALTKANNPCHRQIELQRFYEENAAPVSPKGWFYQAGANLCLGSTIFLRNLTLPEGLKVWLIEGFYCSISLDEAHTDDPDVAALLVELFRDPANCGLVEPKAESGSEAVTLLPGLEEIVEGVPRILLRRELRLR